MKISRIVVAIGLVAALAGCSSDHPDVVTMSKDTGNRFNGMGANEIDIITDAQTGCKYIYAESSTGNYKTAVMSPLMLANGLADCPNATR